MEGLVLWVQVDGACCFPGKLTFFAIVPQRLLCSCTLTISLGFEKIPVNHQKESYSVFSQISMSYNKLFHYAIFLHLWFQYLNTRQFNTRFHFQRSCISTSCYFDKVSSFPQIFLKESDICVLCHRMWFYACFLVVLLISEFVSTHHWQLSSKVSWRYVGRAMILSTLQLLCSYIRGLSYISLGQFIFGQDYGPAAGDFVDS